MSAKSFDDTRWAELPIICPECGNHGEPNGAWTANAWVPFKLIEEVERSYMFFAEVGENGKLELIADVEVDSIDWESGSNLRFECMACLAQFAIPEGARVEFD